MRSKEDDEQFFGFFSIVYLSIWQRDKLCPIFEASLSHYLR